MLRIDGRWARRMPCPLCGATRGEVVFSKHGFDFVHCSGCAVVRVDPQLEPGEIEAIYREGFASKRSARPAPLDDGAYQPILDMLEARDGIGCLLDIGCFSGDFLAAAKRRGWQVHGTEICSAAAEQAAAIGAQIHLADLANAPIEAGSMDAVTLFDVIEHLRDPYGDLLRVRRILRPAGMLYLETPNFSSLARRILGRRWCAVFPWHLFYFSASTLRAVLEAAGFDVVRIRSVGLGPFSTRDPYHLPGQGGGPRAALPSWKRAALRHRRLLKTPYTALRGMVGAPIQIASALGWNLGGKLVVVARRPVWERVEQPRGQLPRTALQRCGRKPVARSLAEALR